MARHARREWARCAGAQYQCRASRRQHYAALVDVHLLVATAAEVWAADAHARAAVTLGEEPPAQQAVEEEEHERAHSRDHKPQRTDGRDALAVREIHQAAAPDDGA